MDNAFWKNAYDQLRNWVTTVGLAIVLAICEYLLENQTWTWKAAIVAAAGAIVKYFVTRDDHKKTRKAVKHAVEETVIATQEVLEKKGEV
jgi:hypothetical protein